jgi:hypothetical protein
MGNSTDKENKKMPAKRQSAPAAKAKPPTKEKRACGNSHQRQR